MTYQHKVYKHGKFPWLFDSQRLILWPVPPITSCATRLRWDLIGGQGHGLDPQKGEKKGNDKSHSGWLSIESIVFCSFLQSYWGLHTRHYHQIPPTCKSARLPVASKAKPHQAIQPSWEARSTTWRRSDAAVSAAFMPPCDAPGPRTTEYIILATPWPEFSKMPWSECPLTGIISAFEKLIQLKLIQLIGHMVSTYDNSVAISIHQIRMRSFRCCLKKGHQKSKSFRVPANHSKSTKIHPISHDALIYHVPH